MTGASDMGWMDSAACLGRWGFTEMSVARQQAVCGGCLVWVECQEYGAGSEHALNLRGAGPVFGGLSPDALRVAARARRREARLARLVVAQGGA